MGETPLETLKYSEGARRLSHWYWKLLVELAILGSLAGNQRNYLQSTDYDIPH